MTKMKNGREKNIVLAFGNFQPIARRYRQKASAFFSTVLQYTVEKAFDNKLPEQKKQALLYSIL
jgi:hypothetical protein